LSFFVRQRKGEAKRNETSELTCSRSTRLHFVSFDQDPEKAVNYLLVAAKMGDVDAQLRESSFSLPYSLLLPPFPTTRLRLRSDPLTLPPFLFAASHPLPRSPLPSTELASCYLHGLGTKGKKDKIQSAFWFRAAIAQGASDAGLSWVYKKKYVKEA